MRFSQSAGPESEPVYKEGQLKEGQLKEGQLKEGIPNKMFYINEIGATQKLNTSKEIVGCKLLILKNKSLLKQLNINPP